MDAVPFGSLQLQKEFFFLESCLAMVQLFLDHHQDITDITIMSVVQPLAITCGGRM